MIDVHLTRSPLRIEPSCFPVTPRRTTTANSCLKNSTFASPHSPHPKSLPGAVSSHLSEKSFLHPSRGSQVNPDGCRHAVRISRHRWEIRVERRANAGMGRNRPRSKGSRCHRISGCRRVGAMFCKRSGEYGAEVFRWTSLAEPSAGVPTIPKGGHGVSNGPPFRGRMAL